MARPEAPQGIDISQCTERFGIESVQLDCFTAVADKPDSCGYTICDSYKEVLKGCFTELKLKPKEQETWTNIFPCFIVPYLPLYDKLKDEMMKIPVIDDQIGNYSTVANALSLALAGAIRKVDKQLISNVAAATDTTLKNKRLEEFVKFLSDTNKLRTILPKGKTFDDTSTESAVLLIMWTNAILANDPMAAGWESKYVEDAIKYFPLKAIK